MKCPKCGKELQHEETCASCPECGGTWFSLERAQRYFGFEVQETATPDGNLPGSSTLTGYSCPDCHDRLVHIEVKPDLVLDQCSRCYGLFFDAGESLKLKSKIGQGFSGPTFERVLQAIIGGQYGPYR